MPQIGRDLGSASRIITEHAHETFEVTKDGGIRRQTGLEKALLLGTRLVGKYQKTRDAKDAKVAVALQNLYQKNYRPGSTVLAPNVNPVLSRFFGGPKNIQDRSSNRLSKEEVTSSKKAATSSKAAKEIKKSKGHVCLLYTSPSPRDS